MQKRNLKYRPSALSLGLLVVLLSGACPRFAAHGQETQVAYSSSASLPDAPQPLHASPAGTDGATPVDPQAAPAQPAAAQGTTENGTYVPGKQTKRILGIVPNFRAVSADAKLPPQSVKDKAVGAFQDSFDYSSFIFAALQGGVAQLQNSYPPFHQGAAGYGRYYWHTFADQTDENLWVEFLIPVATHEDPRYYTLGHGGLLKRAGYSFSRVVITRTDSDKRTVNISEILGAGTAASIADLYYPSQDRDWTKTGQRWLTSVIIDGVTFTFKEFWPDINDHLFHQKD